MATPFGLRRQVPQKAKWRIDQSTLMGLNSLCCEGPRAGGGSRQFTGPRELAELLELLVSDLRGSNLSGFLGQRVIYVPTTAGRRKSHLSGVRMHRRLSGIFAALALAQLSLGGIVAHHAGCEVSSYRSPGQHQHAIGPMDGQRTDARVVHQAADAGDAPACDHSIQGACAGMASCTLTLACVGSARFSAVLRPGQAPQGVIGLTPGLGRAPEPPPPRI